MMCLKSHNIFFVASVFGALLFAGCVKNNGPVTPIKGAPSVQAHVLDGFIYDDKPKPNQKYKYSGTPKDKYMDLGFAGATDKTHDLGGVFVLALQKGGQFNLFYYEYLYYKKSDGTLCKIKSTNPATPDKMVIAVQRLKKVPFTGTWSRTKGAITLTNVGTLTLPATGSTTSATLQFGTSTTPSELSQKKVDVQTMTSDRSLTTWQNEAEEPIVSDVATAAKNLDDVDKCAESDPGAASTTDPLNH